MYDCEIFHTDPHCICVTLGLGTMLIRAIIGKKICTISKCDIIWALQKGSLQANYSCSAQQQMHARAVGLPHMSGAEGGKQHQYMYDKQVAAVTVMYTTTTMPIVITFKNSRLVTTQFKLSKLA